MKRIVIFANGDLPNVDKVRSILRDDDYIICADGGTRHTSSLGLRPDLVIGDMDSTDRVYLRQLQAYDVLVERYSQDKDETDLELAVNKAVKLNPQEIVILAALGGRLDQTLANIALISNLQLATFNLKLDDGVDEIFFCRDQAHFQGRSGDIVSLIPWGGKVTGIQTENLKWKLDGETLYPDKTRGVSNEMIADVAAIRISMGLLLIVHTRKP